MEDRERALSPGGRPIFIASYQPNNETEGPAQTTAEPVAGRLRKHFPAAGTEGLDGESDGYEFRTVFAGSTLAHSYQMVCDFLKQEGYTEVPLPRNAEELVRFRLPTRNKQILLFEDNGYVHNPIKILFPNDGRKKNTLILCLYNEADPDHLLKFHGIL